MHNEEQDLYASYDSGKYAHYRRIHTGKYERQEVKTAKAKERLTPIFKKVKVPFKEVKELRLDRTSPAVPLGDTEDFTIMSNYLIDFWGAVMGDSAVSAYMHLRRYCYGKKDYCYPDIDLIAAKMNRTPKTVGGYLNTLEEYGFIARFYRADITDSNRDVSPLFKIRRYVPMITKEMYEELPKKLKKEHDKFMESLEGISFANNIVGTDKQLETIIEKGEVFNNKEIQEKIELIIQQGQLEEYVVHTLTDEAREANLLFHEHIKKKLSKPSYETWFKNSVLIAEEQEEPSVTILISSEFNLAWVEERYNDMIKNILETELMLDFVEIKYVLITDYVRKTKSRGA